MVNLILKYLNKIKQFFLIIPILIGIMIFAGLFFANQKSKPEFASKTEQIMFETKNKSPKYIITLPEEKKKSLSVEEDDDMAGISPSSVEPEKEKTNEEKISALEIPFLARLKPNNSEIPLSHVSPLGSLLSSDNLPIKNDETEAWEAYGNKVKVLPMFSKVAVVIKNMGINRPNAGLIIDRLPAEISLSFSPYAVALDDFVVQARKKGHETYLDLILPSRDYSTTDSGPQAMDFSQSPDKNVEKLEKLLSQSGAVGGFVFNDGVDDADYNPQFLAVMEMLENRGLLMLDATHGLNVGANNVAGLDRVRADVVIDSNFNKESIVERLKEAEQIALKNGSVVVVAEAKPVAVLAIADWIETFSKQLSYEELRTQGNMEFEKPLALVPLSNLVGVY